MTSETRCALNIIRAAIVSPHALIRRTCPPVQVRQDEKRRETMKKNVYCSQISWLKNVRDFSNKALESSGRLVQIDTRPSDFLHWCNSNGRMANSSARSEYAASILAQMDID